MFDAGRIVARMELDAKKFTSGIDAVQKKIGTFGTIAAGALGGVAIDEAIRRVGDLAIKIGQAVERGAKMQEVDLAFDRIAESAAQASLVINGTRKAAASLSNIEIKQLADRLDLVGVSIGNLPRLAQIAEAIGDATNTQTEEILETIISGAGRANDRMLSMIGLNVDLKKATEAYATALGKTADELTEVEKQQIFLNELLLRGDDIITKLNSNIDTNADKVARWKTGWNNFFDRIDKGLSTTFVGLADAIHKFNMAPVGGFISNIGSVNGGSDFGAVGGVGRSRFLNDKNTPAVRAAVAAQAAAKAAAEAWEKLLARFRSMDFSGKRHMATPRVGEGFGIFQGDVPNWGLRNVDDPAMFGLPQDEMFASLTDSAGAFFEMLVTDSEQAGRAFFSNLAGSIGNVASMMGDMLIFGAIGMQALGTLNPAQALIAGLTLKMIAGALRGVANKNAPIQSSAHGTGIRAPRQQEMREEKAPITIHVDNFVGNKAFIESLAQMLRKVQRERGVELVVT